MLELWDWKIGGLGRLSPVADLEIGKRRKGRMTENGGQLGKPED